MLKIISKLWSSIYDLLMYIEGNSNKSLEQIHKDLDALEMMCRPYADADEPDIFRNEKGDTSE